MVVQAKFEYSTNCLNKSIQRLSTGTKINNAKDNAANYSISTNLTTQLAAYCAVEDNISYGLDLASTASSILAEMQNSTSRLMALSTQARNGTYNSNSLQAMNDEANAIVAELVRKYNTAEYNKVQLFNNEEIVIPKNKPKAGESGFIDKTSVPQEFKAGNSGFIDENFTKIDTTNMTTLTEAIAEGKSIKGGTWAISTIKDLENLANITNQTTDNTSGTTFVLANDIDLSSVQNWTPIGDYDNTHNYNFRGNFNGNGHVIRNLKVEKTTGDNTGFFGRTENAKIENLGIENADVKGTNYVGIMVGGVTTSTINNCYTSGSVSGSSDIGGLLGGTYAVTQITNCYSDSKVSGTGNNTGGLVGRIGNNGTVSNSYATGSVSGTGDYTGGLVGSSTGTVSNSYATGSVSGTGNWTGGLVGQIWNGGTVSNSYATGDINVKKSERTSGNNNGGLIGRANYATITNCFATGNLNVDGYVNTGGLIGNCNNSSITDSYATGNINGNVNYYAGGLIGSAENNINIINSYSTGDINASVDMFAGGFIASLVTTSGYQSSIINSYSTGNVTSGSWAGSFIGKVQNTWDRVSFGDITIKDCAIINSEKNVIGGVYNGNTKYDYDMTGWLNEIAILKPRDLSTQFQVGINGDENSQIRFDTNFKFDFNSLTGGIEKVETLNAIMEFSKALDKKQTELGSLQSRFYSALDAAAVSIETLTSARSTIKDTDVAKENSRYIRNQILQQAGATLLSTANQTPAIALALLQNAQLRR